MAQLRSNDFGTGNLEKGQGAKLTARNLDSGASAQFDGDRKTVLEAKTKIQKIANETEYWQIWVKPKDAKYGKFAPAEKGFVECTIKDFEVEPNLYIKYWIKQKDFVNLATEYGLKPDWQKRGE